MVIIGIAMLKIALFNDVEISNDSSLQPFVGEASTIRQLTIETSEVSQFLNTIQAISCIVGAGIRGISFHSLTSEQISNDNFEQLVTVASSVVSTFI